MSLHVATEGVPTTEDLPFRARVLLRRPAASLRDGSTTGEVAR